MNTEPVAYWDGKEPNVLGLAYHQNDYCFIPLYTHPAELTDEEIQELANENLGDSFDCDIMWMRMFVRAILRKAQEK